VPRFALNLLTRSILRSLDRSLASDAASTLRATAAHDGTPSPQRTRGAFWLKPTLAALLVSLASVQATAQVVAEPTAAPALATTPAAPSLSAPAITAPIPTATATPTAASSLTTPVVTLNTGAGALTTAPASTSAASDAAPATTGSASVSAPTQNVSPKNDAAQTAPVTGSTTTITTLNPTAVSTTATKEMPLVGVVTEVATPAPPSDIWDRIRAGYAMEDLNDPLVAKWEKYYADRPDYIARIVDRSSKYMFYIVTELERRGMPLEIALLPMIESAFNPVANSSAKAAGIWQFIPSTGVNYGMKQDWWSDNRRDIVQATNGALDYLGKLNGMFGDWQLALASYNWGEGSVGRAVQKSKASGGPGTYLSLNMPAETRNYLPKLQAVKNIIRNPGAFGITIASVPNEPYFKTITLAHALDLKRAAQLAEMTEADFVALNPAHNRPVIGGRNEYQLLLPASKADTFLSHLESSEKPRVSWMAYRTRSGDRMESLAARFGTTVAALKSVNGIRAVAPTLPAGYNLLVPSDGPSEDALGSIKNAVFTKFPEYVAPRVHKVRRGENFASIAKRYGVAPATLAKWNRMGKPVARAGQTLYVSGPAPVRQIAAKGSKAGRVVNVARGGKAGRAVAANKRGAAKKVVKRRR
jgi:membrane-bound lytic murein transglycosylase D